ncbi:MAG: hypothetical protein ACPGXK_09735 [Phycisphaerae bacterium]
MSNETQTTKEKRAGTDRRSGAEATVERRSGDRRAAIDRRSGMDRRRGPGRRRAEVRRAAEEGEITGELWEFVNAIDEYKRVNDRPFPSWSEVFEIIRYLGYRKVAEQSDHINDADGEEVLASEAGQAESATPTADEAAAEGTLPQLPTINPASS